MEFIKGIKEPCVPDVKLTRSRDGGQGTASFIFSQPSVFEAGNELGEITGLYMNDDEGTIATTDVNAKFVNGEPSLCPTLRKGAKAPIERFVCGNISLPPADLLAHPCP